jgi:hypothetical protein
MAASDLCVHQWLHYSLACVSGLFHRHGPNSSSGRPALNLMHLSITVIQQVYFVCPVSDSCTKEWPLQPSKRHVYVTETFNRNAPGSDYSIFLFLGDFTFVKSRFYYKIKWISQQKVEIWVIKENLSHKSKSKLCYDQRSVSHLGLKTRSLLLWDSCRFVDVGPSLWREGRSIICQSHSQQ